MSETERKPEATGHQDFGPYAVSERLGLGGMATVHRAKEVGIEGFERVVALKRLLPHLAEDEEFVRSFVREAKLASMLRHPNIVQIFELGRVGTNYFISMEYIDGWDIRRTLRQARRAAGAPPLTVVVSIISELCDALDYAHSRTTDDGRPLGIVHRDISPSNLLVNGEGHLKIIDFGIAKATSEQLRTHTGRIKGKLAYMAPEALAGRALDARSDLFSAGVIFHELLTVRPLFASKNDFKTIQRIQKAQVAPPSRFNPKCPPDLDEIVLRALAKRPADRWQSAAAMRQALQELARRNHLHATNRDVVEWMAWAFSLDAPEPPKPRSPSRSAPAIQVPDGVEVQKEQTSSVALHAFLQSSSRPRSLVDAPLSEEVDEQLIEEIWGTDANAVPNPGSTALEDVPDVTDRGWVLPSQQKPRSGELIAQRAPRPDEPDDDELDAMATLVGVPKNRPQLLEFSNLRPTDPEADSDDMATLHDPSPRTAPLTPVIDDDVDQEDVETTLPGFPAPWVEHEVGDSPEVMQRRRRITSRGMGTQPDADERAPTSPRDRQRAEDRLPDISHDADDDEVTTETSQAPSLDDLIGGKPTAHDILANASQELHELLSRDPDLDDDEEEDIPTGERRAYEPKPPTFERARRDSEAQPTNEMPSVSREDASGRVNLSSFDEPLEPPTQERNAPTRDESGRIQRLETTAKTPEIVEKRSFGVILFAALTVVAVGFGVGYLVTRGGKSDDSGGAGAGGGAADGADVKLTVEVMPERAVIELDGNEIDSPVKVAPGRHTLKVSAGGYRTWVTSMDLAPGEETTLRFGLEKGTSEDSRIGVKSTPTGLDVYVDGTAVGTTPLALDVPPGKHVVALHDRSGEVWSDDVETVANTMHAFHRLLPDAQPRTDGDGPIARPEPPESPEPDEVAPKADDETGKAATEDKDGKVATPNRQPFAATVTKLAGDIPILAPRDGEVMPSSVDAEVCISRRGKVARVDIATKMPGRAKTKLARAMRKWRYEPYRPNHKPVAACFSTRFELPN